MPSLLGQTTVLYDAAQHVLSSGLSLALLECFSLCSGLSQGKKNQN